MRLKMLALAAAASIAATPCMAAGVEASQALGARQSGAVGGLYLSMPLGGTRSGKPQAGLRLQMAHDYRDATAPRAPVVRSNGFDLRLIGEKKPTLFVADRPVTGKQARRHNLVGGGGILSLVILAAAAVGGYVIYKEVFDDDEQCLIPEGCD